MSFILRPYREGDFERLHARAEQASEVEWLGQALAVPGERQVFTAERGGAILAIGGFDFHWPGRAQVFMACSNLREEGFALARALKRLIALQRVRRLEATVRVDFATAIRFLRFLGFRECARLDGYGIDGGDYILFDIVDREACG